MKKLREQRQTLQDVERLIEKQQHLIEELRNYLYRMYLRHGNDIQDGFVEVPETMNFRIVTIPYPMLEVLDVKNLGLPTSYMEILQAIKDLES